MIGQKLGHYRILEQVGSGGMGVVYRARDEQLERDVALKVLPSGTLSDEASRRHFRKEALALAKISHPNIETVYEFASQDGMDFLVMEYVPGKTLADKLAAGALPEKEVVSVGMQVVSGLEEAHERGIVHRDLKPKNIAITPKGQVKILDFGLAKLLPKPDDATTDELSETQAGAGTLPYMPPEQLQGESVDARADIYTMGAVLYEMATNSKAVSEIIPSRLIEAVLNRPPIAPRSINSRVSPELERVILKCLDKDPTRRYQSAKELLVDLRRLDSGAAPLPIPAPQSHPKSFWSHAAAPAKYAAAIVLTLAVVSTAANFRGWRDRLLGHPRAPLIHSIAIIPFRNAGLDKNYDYFGVGLADVLNAKLTNARILEVHAVPLPTNLAGWNADPLKTGRTLGVDAILSGSYQIEDGKLSLRYTLLDLKREVQVAGNDFQAPFTRSIDAEHALATQITNSLQASVSREQLEHLASASTQQNEAFQAYLRSSYEMEVFWRQPSSAQLDRAEQDLNEALSLDPHFSMALVSLAKLHWLAAFWGYANDPRILDEAEQQTNQAIQLEPDSGEAYAARALIELQRASVEDARKSIRAAFTRSPNSALAYYAAGLYYMTKGLAAKSIPCFLKAQELNPELIRSELGLAYRSQGDFLKARDQLRLDLESHPDDRVTAAVLAGVLVGLDDLDDARQIEHTSLQYAPNDPTVQYALALLRVREGAPFRVDAWLAPYEKVYWADAGYCFDVASVYATAKRSSDAVRWLRRARELGLSNYPFVSRNPLFANLRGDPEFQSFLETSRHEWEAADRREQVDPLTP